ncbi:hypothetical protein CWI36_1472p0010, partial [Hamiltosporidium magnivora]
TNFEEKNNLEESIFERKKESFVFNETNFEEKINLEESIFERKKASLLFKKTNFDQKNILERKKEKSLIFNEKNIFSTQNNFTENEVEHKYNTPYNMCNKKDKNHLPDTSNSHVNISIKDKDITEESYYNDIKSNTLYLYDHINNTPVLSLTNNTINNTYNILINNTPVLSLNNNTHNIRINNTPINITHNILINNTPVLSLEYIFFTLLYNKTLLSYVDNYLKSKMNKNNNFLKNKNKPKMSVKMIETSSPDKIKRKKIVLSEKVLNLRPFTYHWSNSYKNMCKNNLRVFSAPSGPTLDSKLFKETEYFCKNKIDFYSSEIEISSDFEDSILKNKIDFNDCEIEKPYNNSDSILKNKIDFNDCETKTPYNYKNSIRKNIMEFNDCKAKASYNNNDCILKNNNFLNNSTKETFYERKNVKLQSCISKKRHLIDFWSLQETGEKHSLPTLGPGKCDSIQRISTEVVKKCVECKYNIKYKIIDCRFMYEYRGGHIQGAINANTTKQVDSLFSQYQGHILIFHCEYSSIRAPRLAKYLRNKDREVNKYPKLFFPEIYIMEGGYKNFYWNFKDFCEPKMYVPMGGNKVTNRIKCVRNKMGSE